MTELLATVQRNLREVIAALDRRVPQPQRVGEVAIAPEAAALKARALARIQALEQEPASAQEEPRSMSIEVADADVERRRAAWQASATVQERTLRRRFIDVLTVVAFVGLAALLVYALPSL